MRRRQKVAVCLLRVCSDFASEWAVGVSSECFDEWAGSVRRSLGVQKAREGEGVSFSESSFFVRGRGGLVFWESVRGGEMCFLFGKI